MTTMRPHLWLVLPVFQDVPAFLQLRDRVQNVLAPIAGRYEMVRFLVIDDSAGADPAMSELANLDDVEVLTPAYGLGHQHAIVLGLRSLAPRLNDDDIVVTVDSDGEDRPEDLPRLLAALEESPSPRTVVVARRTHRQVSLAFRFAYVLFRLTFRVLVGMVVDSGNFAAYYGWTARRVLFHPNFDLCYSSSLLSLGLPLVKVPCARGERYAGRSRMTQSGLAIHGLRMMMPFLDRITIRALFTFGSLFAIGLALTLAVGLGALFGADVPSELGVAAAVFGVLALLGFGNFVVLFAVFTNFRGLRLGPSSTDTAQVAAEPPRQALLRRRTS
jgi:polyisoprenyl-phosphate glycosyltransferase